VGRVLGAHGTKGALRVESLSDVPGRFAPGAAVWLQAVRRVIQSCAPGRGGLVLKLEGIDDRKTAEQMKDEVLEVPESERPPLPPGSYYTDELIGLTVVDPEGRLIGTLDEVLETGANDVYVVRGPQGETLLPAVDDVVLEIDLERRRMVARPMDAY
jgi:16S rRNA processing protein RimM